MRAAWIAVCLAACTPEHLDSGPDTDDSGFIVTAVLPQQIVPRRTAAAPANVPATWLSDRKLAPGDEVMSLRGARTHGFRTSTGHALLSSTRRLNHRGPDGQWRPNDPAFQRVGRPSPIEVTWAATQNAFAVWLPDDSRDGVLFTYDTDDDGVHDVSARWIPERFAGQAPLPGALTVDGARADWTGTWPGVDEQVEVTATGMKHRFVLHQPQRGAFEGFLQLSDELELWADGVPITDETVHAGALEARAPSGDLAFRVPAALAWEQADPAATVPVAYRVRPAAGGWLLDVVPDWTWLSESGRRFPVVVDPTYDTAQDWTGSVTTTQRVFGDLVVGDQGGIGWRGFAKFDISALPVGATVTRADLNLNASIAGQTTGNAHKSDWQHLTFDPTTATLATVWGDYEDEADYYNDQTVLRASGPVFVGLDAVGGAADIEGSAVAGWYAIGIHEEQDNATAAVIDGFNGLTPPYLTVEWAAADRIDTAVASNTSGQFPGAGPDPGDQIVLTFSSATNGYAIGPLDADTTLPIVGGHRWGRIQSATWSGGNTVLTIVLGGEASIGMYDEITVAPGTITVNSNTPSAARLTGRLDGLDGVYYVREDGNDVSPDCTLRENDPSAAYRTIAQAWTCLSANRTDLTGLGHHGIIVGEGYYTTSVTLAGIATTASDTVYLIGEVGAGRLPVIEPPADGTSQALTAMQRHLNVAWLRFHQPNTNGIPAMNRVTQSPVSVQHTAYTRQGGGVWRMDAPAMVFDMRHSTVRMMTFWYGGQSGIIEDIGGQADITLRNNVFLVGGIGSAHVNTALRYSDATIDSDYNLFDLRSVDSDIAVVSGGRIGGLAAWQGTGNDLNSVEGHADFVSPIDLRLRSPHGTWDPDVGEWVQRNAYSAGLDRADPSEPVTLESIVNGSRNNLGAFGDSVQASRAGPPAIDTLSTNGGMVGTITPITMTGWNFSTVTGVTLDAAPAAYNIISDTELLVQAPQGLTTGANFGLVTNAEGNATFLFSAYADAAPTITTVAPTHSGNHHPTRIRIEGDNLGKVVDATLGGTPLDDLVVVDDGVIEATVPRGLGAGTFGLQVSGSTGTSTGGPSFTVAERRVYTVDQTNGTDGCGPSKYNQGNPFKTLNGAWTCVKQDHSNSLVSSQVQAVIEIVDSATYAESLNLATLTTSEAFDFILRSEQQPRPVIAAGNASGANIDVTIDHVTIEGVFASGSFYGMHLDGIGLNIIDCQISANDPGYGIEVESDSDITVRDSHLLANGIAFDVLQGPLNTVTFIGNRVEGSISRGAQQDEGVGLYQNNVFVDHTGAGAFALYLLRGSFTVHNNTFYNNVAGVYLDTGSITDIRNNIFSNNPIGVQTNPGYFDQIATIDWNAWDANTQDIDSVLPLTIGPNFAIVPPDFVSLAGRDLHMRSKAGTWTDAQTWTTGTAQSGAIDRGDPELGVGLEPNNHGGLPNLGAYGRTAQASPPLPFTGSVVITEVQAQPATEGDPAGEYVEVRNLGSEPLALHGCELFANSGSHLIRQRLVAPANGLVVLARSGGALGNLVPDYVYDGVDFDPVSDSIGLRCGIVEGDRVAWDAGWGLAAGQAITLDPTFQTPGGNDAPGAWCTTTDIYWGTDRGTPGDVNDSCNVGCVDNDGDGFEDQSCGGTDCDDGDSSVNPGVVTDGCDTVDNDCDTLVDEDADITWYFDGDGDTYTDPGNTTLACTDPGADWLAAPSAPEDCDDGDSSVNPGVVTDGCDTVDNDCDTLVDEDADLLWYPDCDGDGDARSDSPVAACSAGTAVGDCPGAPAGAWTQTAGGDCDDSDSGRSSLTAEVVADGIDQDCAGGDLCHLDNDGDGYGGATGWASSPDLICGNEGSEADNADDCNDSDASVNPGVTSDTCDNVDSDCDGSTDEDPELTWYFDGDADGFTHPSTTLASCADPGVNWEMSASNTADCDDADATVYPGNPANDVCDGVDSDCDGSIDENPDLTWYYDGDNDGFDDGRRLLACTGPDANWSQSGPTAKDCDDTDVTAFPGQTWFADCDGDGDTAGPSVTACNTTEADAQSPCANATPPQAWEPGDDQDCDDADAQRGPSLAELPEDTIDNDCDGADAAWCWTDGDGDGYGDEDGTAQDEVAADGVCDPRDGQAEEGGDCDDDDPTVHPGATEEPGDDIDQDCDGADLLACHPDADDDGYGDPEITVAHVGTDCTGPGVTDDASDCDDTDPDVHPGAIEVWYDGVDQNCDGASDHDQDLDGVDARQSGGSDCDDEDPAIFPGAVERPNDKVDQDCTGHDLVQSWSGGVVGTCGCHNTAPTPLWLALLALAGIRRR